MSRVRGVGEHRVGPDVSSSYVMALPANRKRTRGPEGHAGNTLQLEGTVFNLRFCILRLARLWAQSAAHNIRKTT